MHTLIVGGTSGLGLELAKHFSDKGQVTVVGRHDPEESTLTFRHLDLTIPKFSVDSGVLIDELSKIDTFIYAAGFYQEGRIDELALADIERMERIGLFAPAWMLNRILTTQNELSGFIAITSTSQFKPRLLEPMYAATKAGLAMLAKCVAEDERVGRTLVAAPAGMDTSFWDKTDKDTRDWLDPTWVAEEIATAFADRLEDQFRFKEIHFNRGSREVEIFEQYE